MLEHEVVINYGANIKLKFKDCNHIITISRKHYENNEYVCNECSILNGDEFLYDSYNGLVPRTEKLLEKFKTSNNKKNNSAKFDSNGYMISGIDVGFKIKNKSCYDIDDFKGLCGIYSIHNIKNNKRYIGSTRDFKHRFKSHYRHLNKSDHHSYKLKIDFKSFVESDFEFEILEILRDDCDNSLLHLTEQKYIDLCDTVEKGYNVNPIAGFNGSVTDYNKLT